MVSFFLNTNLTAFILFYLAMLFTSCSCHPFLSINCLIPLRDEISFNSKVNPIYSSSVAKILCFSLLLLKKSKKKQSDPASNLKRFHLTKNYKKGLNINKDCSRSKNIFFSLMKMKKKYRQHFQA